MNSKIIFVALLAIAHICSASDQEEIALKREQLKTKRSAIEADMLQLRDNVEKEMYKYREYLTLCSSMWETHYKQYKEISGKLYSVIKEGGDIEKFFEEKASCIRDEADMFWIIFLTYQNLSLTNFAHRFMARLEDLLEVNRELHLLQQSVTE
jgi:hypothetical protein